MELTTASKTDPGRVRPENQDALLTDLPLVALADGMGGHRGGRQAAMLALEVVAGFKDKLEDRGNTDATAVLRDAMQEANRVVLEQGSTDPDLEGMGTTLIAVWMDGSRLSLGHVGDSRAYLLRGGELEQLTEDQTVAQDMVRQGRLGAEEAESSPQRHILMQSIGTTPELEVSLVSFDLEEGDRILLASDGLSGMVSPEAIRDTLLDHTDPDRACDVLVEAANAAGGTDNISVVVVDAGERPAPGTGPPPRSPVVDTRRIRPTGGPSKRVGRRLILVSAGVLTIAAVAAGWYVASSRPSYVVATRHGAIVLLDGRTADDQERMASGEVVWVYRGQTLDSFPETVRSDLRSGIHVDSHEQGDRVVNDLPRLLGPLDTSTAAPDPTPTTSPSEESP